MVQSGKRFARVAIHGSYFSNNFGDTLLTRILCDWASEEVGANNVYLAVPGKKEEQEAIGYKVVTPTERRTISHLIFSGGGYFGEPPLPLTERYRWYFRNYSRHLAWVREFESAKKAIFGIGVGPLSDPVFRSAVRRLLSQMQIVYARDRESLEYIRAYGFTTTDAWLGADLAMSLEASDTVADKAVAVHVSGMPYKLFTEIISTLSSGQIKAQAHSIELLFDGPVSIKKLQLYQELCKDSDVRANVVEYCGVNDLLQRIPRYNVIITSKLHVGIAGTALGRKIIAIPIHPKTIRFYRSLGLQEFCLNWDEQLSTKLERLIDPEHKYSFRREVVSSQISEMRGKLRLFLADESRQIVG